MLDSRPPAPPPGHEQAEWSGGAQDSGGRGPAGASGLATGALSISPHGAGCIPTTSHGTRSFLLSSWVSEHPLPPTPSRTPSVPLCLPISFSPLLLPQQLLGFSVLFLNLSCPSPILSPLPFQLCLGPLPSGNSPTPTPPCLAQRSPAQALSKCWNE